MHTFSKPAAVALFCAWGSMLAVAGTVTLSGAGIEDGAGAAVQATQVRCTIQRFSSTNGADIQFDCAGDPTQTATNGALRLIPLTGGDATLGEIRITVERVGGTTAAVKAALSADGGCALYAPDATTSGNQEVNFADASRDPSPAYVSLKPAVDGTAGSVCTLTLVPTVAALGDPSRLSFKIAAPSEGKLALSKTTDTIPAGGNKSYTIDRVGGVAISNATLAVTGEGKCEVSPASPMTVAPSASKPFTVTVPAGALTTQDCTVTLTATPGTVLSAASKLVIAISAASQGAISFQNSSASITTGGTSTQRVTRSGGTTNIQATVTPLNGCLIDGLSQAKAITVPPNATGTTAPSFSVGASTGTTTCSISLASDAPGVTVSTSTLPVTVTSSSSACAAGSSVMPADTGRLLVRTLSRRQTLSICVDLQSHPTGPDVYSYGSIVPTDASSADIQTVVSTKSGDFTSQGSACSFVRSATSGGYNFGIAGSASGCKLPADTRFVYLNIRQRVRNTNTTVYTGTLPAYDAPFCATDAPDQVGCVYPSCPVGENCPIDVKHNK